MSRSRARKDAAPAEDAAGGTLRIDKWLWHARFFKTRSLAADAANDGKIRLGEGEARSRVSKASQTIRPGDVLTIPKGRELKIVRVLALGSRRGPAEEARALYEDLTPPPQPWAGDEGADGAAPPPAVAPASGERAPGAGPPKKRDRRQLAKFLGRE